MTKKRKVKSSEIISIRIKCGACDVESDVTGEMSIAVGSCTCSEWQMTCMCDLYKKLEFACPQCKYFDSIDII